MLYVYHYYSCIEEEVALCALEMRAFFGYDTQSRVIESPLKIDPNRSPFIRERIDVLFEGNSLEVIIDQIKKMDTFPSTFRVVYVKNQDVEEAKKLGFHERRKIEREVGLHVPGEPDLVNPDILFGIMNANGRWVFGRYHKNKAIWLNHQNKPHSYSTALSARMARAVVNIAVPDSTGKKVIDPCCGIGTVLVEGLSMGVDIVGSDVNPLVLPGTRENIAHFCLETEVMKKDILDITEQYDVAIIDLPYNLCSVITEEQQLRMLQSARQFTQRVVIITIEAIDSIIQDAGFNIIDRCEVSKGRLIRQVLVCE